MIYVLDNGKAGPEKSLVCVVARTDAEVGALNKFEAVLRVDPYREGGGIVLAAVDMSADPGDAVSAEDLFASPEGWSISTFPADTLADEELMAVLAFAAAWPSQRNLDARVIAAARREARRRGFASDAIEPVAASSPDRRRLA